MLTLALLACAQDGHVELLSAPEAAGSRRSAQLSDGKITVAPQLSDAELLQLMEPHADVQVTAPSLTYRPLPIVLMCMLLHVESCHAQY